MNSSNPYPENERPVEAWCDPVSLHVKLADGREVVTPLWWYPRLFKASASERNNVELMLDGVHWPDLDEDLSIRGMLKGWKYPDAVAPRAVA
ncbi:hypothetical protein ABID16_002111 [Rhizobium aquaticum]|uniref:DUF2442 domain-containing protein n=1 Tax=Rhizobium aquaticum TaxID=1549636 RepID=A0ABV2IZ58_9HYPH